MGTDENGTDDAGKWLSLSYYGISTVKTGLIRFSYGNYHVHVGKKNGFLRFVTVYYGLKGNDTRVNTDANGEIRVSAD